MRHLFLLFLTLLASCLATPARAETAKGTAIRVDAAARKMELRTEAGAVWTCTLKPDAELLFREQKIRLNEVKPGDRVEVTFERSGADFLVSKLVVTQRPMRAMADSPAPSRPAPTPPRAGSPPPRDTFSATAAPPPAESAARSAPAAAAPFGREDAGGFWRQKAYYATDRQPLAIAGRAFPLTAFLLGSGALAALGFLGWLLGRQEGWRFVRRVGIWGLLIAAAVASTALFSAWWQGPASDLAAGETFGKLRGDELRYGFSWISVPKRHVVGQNERPSVFRLEFKPDPNKHIALLESQRLPRDGWLAELKQDLAKAAKKEIFVFIHGYNVGFEDALRRTGQLAFDLQLQGPAVLFSWPSQAGVIPYTVDENCADLATDHFQSVLQDLATETGAQTVHLLAHSMGNRVLAETLARLADQKANWLPAKLGEIVLAAPDVDRDKFRRRYHPLLKSAGRRLTLYASANDRALQASRLVHGNPRAGDAGPGLLILEQMDSIDVTRVDTSFLGHSYYGDRPELLDDIRGILDGSSPPQRSWLSRLLLENLAYWEMKAKGGG